MSGAAPTTVSGLTDADFDRFRLWFYRRTGIQFAPSKRYFVDKRIAACIEDAEAADFAEWFSRIRLANDRALEVQLINRLTVHETYFMREEYQLACMTDSVLPEIMRSQPAGKPVRILSLPCSTGDEPYSIAIWLLERWRQLDEVDVEIAAMDIDATSLQTARAGVYGRRALHRLTDAQRSRWFERVDATSFRIAAELRDAVGFVAGNVADTKDMQRHRGYDIVFCRNLLIYFDETSAALAAENLFGMLRPGGHLFLGHSESMSRISSIFEPIRYEHASSYRRPLLEST